MLASHSPSTLSKLATLRRKSTAPKETTTIRPEKKQQQEQQQSSHQAMPLLQQPRLLASRPSNNKRVASKPKANDQPPVKVTKSMHPDYLSKSVLPSAYQLMRNTEFGKPHVNISFTSESRLPQVLLIVYKQEFLKDTKNGYQRLWNTYPETRRLYDEWQRLKDVDFRELREMNPDWESQTEIPTRLLDLRLACLMHYDMDVATMIRFMGGNYIAAHRNPSQILSNIQGIVPEDVYDDVKRILTFGAPTKFIGTGTYSEFKRYQNFGNFPNLERNLDIALKALNKEDKRQFVLTLPRWISDFIPNLWLAPGDLIQKPGKKDRLIFNASHQVSPDSMSYNMIANKTNEPDIVFASAERRFWKWIYNLRISYPDREIRLCDDDVTAAFRLVKYNIEIIAAKGYCVGDFLALSCGQTFGDCTSPPNWEPFARARTALAEHFAATNTSVPAFDDYLDKVTFQPEPEQDVNFAPAEKDKYNQGVFDENGRRKPTEYNMHVDDNLYAEVGILRMKMAMRYSIHALHQVLGGDDPATRPNLVDIEKFIRDVIGHRRTQLGVTIDTRLLRVEMTEKKRIYILNILKTTWGPHRRSFTISEAAQLLGMIMDAARTCHWGIFLFISLQQAMSRLLNNNYRRLLHDESHQQMLEMLGNLSAIHSPSKYRWFSKKVSQALWKTKTKTFISSEIRTEIDFCTSTFNDPQRVQWSAPIALLIEREPSYIGWGDACLVGGGGFSLSLKFWWAMEWEEEIQKRTIHYLPKKSPLLISINLLEYAAVIIGLAGSILAWEEEPDPKPAHPMVQLFTDNTTANSWTKRIAGLKSPQARNLARLLCHLLMLTPDLGLSTEHIDGDENEVADYLSRLRKQLGTYTPLNFSEITQKYPQLRTCRRFLPSPEFLSLLCSSLLTGSVAIPTTRVPLGRLTPEPITT